MGVLTKNLQLLCSSRGGAPSSELDKRKDVTRSISYIRLSPLCPPTLYTWREISTGIKYSGP